MPNRPKYFNFSGGGVNAEQNKAFRKKPHRTLLLQLAQYTRFPGLIGAMVANREDADDDDDDDDDDDCIAYIVTLIFLVKI